MNERIELNLHTKMGSGFIEPNEMIKEMTKRGYNVFAITDENSVQAFPTIDNSIWEYNETHEDKVKILYGAELNVIDTYQTFCPEKDPFVVFDIETTGISITDEIIEIVASKWKCGKIVDRFKRFVKPKKVLEKSVEVITHITNEMVENKEPIEVVMEELKQFIGNLPLVTENAFYVRKFLNNIPGEVLKNPIYDILELTKYIYPKLKHYKLQEITQYLGISDIEKKGLEHHIYVISQIFFHLCGEESIKHKDPFKITILVKNQKGLKHLYELITQLHTEYKKGLPLEIVREKREGLLIGSTAIKGEIERYFDWINEEELRERLSFYDYIEIAPPSRKRKYFPDATQDKIKRFMNIAFEMSKLVVATSNAHYLEKKEEICFEVIKKNFAPISLCLLSKEELLEQFSFLGEKTAYNIVVKNPNLINNLCEKIKIKNKTMCLPKFENGDIILARKVYKMAHHLYGVLLPKEVSERIALELYGVPILKLKHVEHAILLGRNIVFQKIPDCRGKGILGCCYETMFLIPKMVIEKGYKRESRGALGSSLIIYLLGITEVNPLPPHYRCPDCKYTIFEKCSIRSGFDLKDKTCPVCNTFMKKDGHHIPYVSFLGTNASILPDININFADTAIDDIKKEVEILFGRECVFYPGVIMTMNLHHSYLKIEQFCKQTGKKFTEEEKEDIAYKIANKKVGMGIYPGGILIISKNSDMTEFTPIEKLNNKYMTHFDYHDLREAFPKFGFLGHSGITMLQSLETDTNIMDIPFDDEKVFELFKSTKPLGLKKDTNIETGTLGIEEFSVWSGMKELRQIGIFPQNFSECVKLLGLSHGTGVFEENALELLKQGIPLSDVIAHREDIMNRLLEYLSYEEAYEIMELIGKGRHHKDLEKWERVKIRLQEVGIEEWYIDSCEKINYLFPKAHHISYMIRLYRFLYAKIYEPEAFYKAYFKCYSKLPLVEYQNKSYEEIEKEIALFKEKDSKMDDLEVLLEAMARNMKLH